MKRQEVTVTREGGFQGDQATNITSTASRFTCTIWLEQGHKRVNAKSLMGVMSMRIKQGDSFSVTATGADEKEAIDAMVKLVK